MIFQLNFTDFFCFAVIHPVCLMQYKNSLDKEIVLYARIQTDNPYLVTSSLLQVCSYDGDKNNFITNSCIYYLCRYVTQRKAEVRFEAQS